MAGYDPRCEVLARDFLPPLASDRLYKDLAQHIQDAIEDWLRAEADRLIAEIGAQKVQ
jgi:hypothetical protein